MNAEGQLVGLRLFNANRKGSVNLVTIPFDSEKFLESNGNTYTSGHGIVGKKLITLIQK